MATFSRETEGVTVVSELRQHVENKILVITGASAKGLGAGIAISVAHGNPAHILLLARNASKVDSVIKEIAEINKNVITAFVQIELEDLDSVRKTTSTVDAAVDRIDLFINNAGIMAIPEYKTNKAGLESQFATNHVGHFLLTNLLTNKILAPGKGARIVNLISDGHMIGHFRFDDHNFSAYRAERNTIHDLATDSQKSQTSSSRVNWRQDFEAEVFYRLRFIRELLITETGLGGHVNEKMLSDINPVALKITGVPFKVGRPKTTQQGVSTTVVAALDPRIAADSGAYMEDCAVKEAREYATSTENAKKLWSISEELVRQKFDF